MQNKIRVTQIFKVAYPPSVGGIESDMKQIFDSVSDEKFDKEIICCSNSLKDEVINNVKYTRCKYLFDVAANYISPQFIYKLSKVNTDIIHYHMPCIFAIIAHYLAKPQYKKMIISFHGGIYGYDKYMRYFNKIYNKFYDDCDLLHVYTSNLLDTEEVLNRNRHKAFILPYSVTVDKSFEYRIKNNPVKQLLTMGRLVKWKGIQNAILAVKNIEGVMLNIVGDGPYRQDLENIVKDNGLQAKVKFYGKIVDADLKEKIYNNTDIFVFPSIRKSESFGQVQIQAMSYGIPVINTQLGTGANYISIDGETGITVEPDNVEQLEAAIKTLISNDNLRAEYGQRARIRIEDLFDIEKNKHLYEKMYETVLNDNCFNVSEKERVNC